MLKNVGMIDRLVRLALFIGFAIFAILNIASGLWWIGLFGLIFLFTGVAGYCPIWHGLGVNTTKKVAK